MSRWREEVNHLVSPTIPISFFHWIVILNFFTSHKNELDIHEVELLSDRCETIRVEINKTVSSGTQPIEKHELNPNIYLHLVKLKVEQENTDSESLTSSNSKLKVVQ